MVTKAEIEVMQPQARATMAACRSQKQHIVLQEPVLTPWFYASCSMDPREGHVPVLCSHTIPVFCGHRRWRILTSVQNLSFMGSR